MKSLTALLIKGPGPSSSHTIGPYRICDSFLNEYKNENFVNYIVTLYGSLAFTGKGHKTDEVIKNVFKSYNKQVEIIFNYDLDNIKHPNTLQIEAIKEDNSSIIKRFQSIGGGAFKEENKPYIVDDIYPFNDFTSLKEYLKKSPTADLYEVIENIEGKSIFEYGKNLILYSFNLIEEMINSPSTDLPGLNLKTVSSSIFKKANECKDEHEKMMMLLTSFAYATAEANALGKQIVTTPTCGASGVVPSCLYYQYKYKNYSLDKIVKAFLVGGLICNFIKENAAISGAMLGCQAEIGSASSFASAALAYLDDLSIYQIEYAAEVSMEHFLGLTCDPVKGYVQIPCIERNGVASIHAYTSYLYSKNISIYRENKVSFDNVIKVMKETGNKMDKELKETSLGGLAKIISNC
jgi:L-serine dehydratase